MYKEKVDAHLWEYPCLSADPIEKGRADREQGSPENYRHKLDGINESKFQVTNMYEHRRRELEVIWLWCVCVCVRVCWGLGRGIYMCLPHTRIHQQCVGVLQGDKTVDRTV